MSTRGGHQFLMLLVLMILEYDDQKHETLVPVIFFRASCSHMRTKISTLSKIGVKMKNM